MTNWSKLDEALQRQSEFSSLFFDAKTMTSEEKEERLKTLALALHSEVSGICDAVNYKDHRSQKHPVDTQKILYKSTDAYRYVLAMINLWGISAQDFASALSQKDDFLHYRHALSQKKWEGQPVVLFDLDDVLAEFRKSFCEYVTADSGVFIDPQSSEYYNVATFKENGLSNEHYFRTFVEKHGFLHLEANDKYMQLLFDLKKAGCWIQIITARPEKSDTAFYDTYSWLRKNDVPADGVGFSPEKLVWLADQEFYGKAKVVAIDDSAKHASEYAKHGVKTFVPKKPYNSEVDGRDRIMYIKDEHDPYKEILIALT